MVLALCGRADAADNVRVDAADNVVSYFGGEDVHDVGSKKIHPCRRKDFCNGAEASVLRQSSGRDGGWGTSCVKSCTKIGSPTSEQSESSDPEKSGACCTRGRVSCTVVEERDSLSSTSTSR